MGFKVARSDKFMKKIVKLIRKNPSLKPKIVKTLKLIEEDPFYPSLRLHQLKGKLNGKYSISIDMNYRIILELIIKDNEIILLDIGSHDEVY